MKGISSLKIAAIGIAGLASVGKSADALSAEASAKVRPNILFIAVDDLRTELSCYGNEHIHSPHIDQLAREGVLFERAYVQQAICMASRASMLTGYHAAAHRIYSCLSVRDLMPDALTINRFFEQQGYQVHGAGKVYHYRSDHVRQFGEAWDLVQAQTSAQTQGRGYITPEAIAQIQDERGPAWENADVEDNAYPDGMYADWAVGKLGELKKSSSPFFLAVGFHKPHLPFNAPKKYWDLYDADKIRTAANPYYPVNGSEYGKHRDSELRSYSNITVPYPEPIPMDQQKMLIHGYYACVSYIDAQIGKIVEALKEKGLFENTVIVFWGDHGYKLGEHGMWIKHTNFEIDTRVPLIISAPGMRNGSKTEAFAELIDIFPTLADLCGFEIPGHLHGDSLVPVLNNPSSSVKDRAYSIWPSYRGERTDEERVILGYSVRTDEFRYTEWRHKATDKLFDRELFCHLTDPSENTNVIGLKQYASALPGLESRIREYRSTFETAKDSDVPPENEVLPPDGEPRMQSILLLELWTQGKRTVQSLPKSAEWFSSRPAGELTAVSGAMIQKMGSSCAVLSYFTDSPEAAVRLNSGETLKLSFSFSMAARSAGSQYFRFGLFKSGGERISRDGAGGRNSVYSGVSGYSVFLSSLDAGSSVSMRARTDPASENLLNSSDAYTKIFGKANLSSAVGNNEIHTVDFLITRTAGNGVILSGQLRGAGKPVASWSGQDQVSGFHEFDMLAFAFGANNGESFTLHGVELSLSSGGEVLPLPAALRGDENDRVYDGTAPEERFVYKESDGVPRHLEVYFPPDWKQEDSRPGIIFFHGGGWQSGSLSQFRRACEYFASRGMVCASAEYRMIPREERHTVPSGISRKEFCITDAKSAVRWMKQNAGRLGLDASRLVAGAGSAGGHIAVLATTNPGLNDPEDPAQYDTSVAAYLLFNPAFDPDNSKFTETDALQHVGNGFAPAAVFFGTEDEKWKPGWDAVFEELNRIGGAQIGYWLAEGKGHGFFNRPPWQDVTFIAADRFLSRLGFTEGDPLLPAPPGYELIPVPAGN